VDEINSGVYAFEAHLLGDAVKRVPTDNAKGEEYLTDAVELIARDGGRVLALPAGDWREAVGVNDRSELAAAARFMRDRINRDWMLAGVTIMDPASTWVDVDVRLGPDVTLLPQTYLRGRTAVRSGATVGPDCTLEDTEVDAGATVTRSVCVGARIGAGATVGPYSYLRAKTVLGPRTKAGAFVEMKNARLAAEAKVPHLSYVGDASIGERTNIGAATVFVNYDGLDKHHTEVGDDVRIGSDSMLVAPVVVGDGAYTAAGSVITSDVPPGALAVSRGRQRNIEDWVHRRRPGTAAARAAERARERQPRSGQDENGDAETKPGRGAAER
jgi:bifunctional UDP-N-acetylglucosamine pyrophosphorylase/glucosamine-1-phosphate N-acetyltransferase